MNVWGSEEQLERRRQQLFWEKVDKSGECHIWIGLLTDKGYGKLTYRNKTERAHVVSFIINTGRRPVNIILHKCHNKRCVKFEHLKDGTVKENNSTNLPRQLCYRGHLLSKENTLIQQNGQRKCKICTHKMENRRNR